MGFNNSLTKNNTLEIINLIIEEECEDLEEEICSTLIYLNEKYSQADFNKSKVLLKEWDRLTKNLTCKSIKKIIKTIEELQQNLRYGLTSIEVREIKEVMLATFKDFEIKYNSLRMSYFSISGITLQDQDIFTSWRIERLLSARFSDLDEQARESEDKTDKFTELLEMFSNNFIAFITVYYATVWWYMKLRDTTKEYKYLDDIIHLLSNYSELIYTIVILATPIYIILRAIKRAIETISPQIANTVDKGSTKLMSFVGVLFLIILPFIKHDESWTKTNNYIMAHLLSTPIFFVVLFLLFYSSTTIHLNKMPNFLLRIGKKYNINKQILMILSFLRITVRNTPQDDILIKCETAHSWYFNDIV